jgi:hypothetical protein
MSTLPPEQKFVSYLICSNNAQALKLTTRQLVQFLRFSPLSGRIRLGEITTTIAGYSIEAKIWTHDHDLIERWLEERCECVNF